MIIYRQFRVRQFRVSNKAGKNPWSTMFLRLKMVAIKAGATIVAHLAANLFTRNNTPIAV